MDMTAAVADHKQDVYDTGREPCGDVGHIQVDHHTASTVGIDGISALFLPWRRELGGNTVADVIALGQMAPAVEKLDARYNLRRAGRQTCRSVGRDPERVFAFERRVRAAEIVIPSRPSRTGKRRQNDRRRQRSFPKPAFHLHPPFVRTADRTLLSESAL